MINSLFSNIAICNSTFLSGFEENGVSDFGCREEEEEEKEEEGRRPM